jgi:hypothetical protein
VLGTISRPHAALIAAVLVLASCGVIPPDNVGLPTRNDLDGYPAALLEATLVRDGACLVAQGPDPRDRWLPIWPPGFSLAGDVVLDGGAEVARVGDVVKLGGGEYHEPEYDVLRTLMPADVPDACRGGAYWLVGEVVP